MHEHTRRIRDMPSVLVNEMPCSDEFKVRNATSHVARLRYATRDYLLHMLFFVFTPLFLPSLCARDGFVGAPPACREKAETRKKYGDRYGPALISNPFFQNFHIFDLSIRSNSFRLGQETWIFYWNRMTSIPKILNGTLFRRIPS